MAARSEAEDTLGERDEDSQETDPRGAHDPTATDSFTNSCGRVATLSICLTL